VNASARPPVPPVLVLALAVAAFSWAGPLVRFTDASALAISAWRLLLSLVFIAGIVALRPTSRRNLASVSMSDLGLAAGAGVLLALHFWSWIASIQYTSVASSVMLVSTQPLFVALLSVLFLKERPRQREWVGMAVAVLGTATIGWGDFALGGTALFGDALALGAALLAAMYYSIGRSLRQRLDIWSYVLLVYGAAALVLTVVVMLSPDVPLVRGYATRDWMVFLALAAGPMLIGHTGVNYSLRYVRAYMANLAVLGEPIGATLIAWALPAIAETPSPEVLLGGLLVLAGVAVAVTPGRTPKSSTGSSPGSG